MPSDQRAMMVVHESIAVRPADLLDCTGWRWTVTLPAGEGRDVTDPLVVRDLQLWAALVAELVGRFRWVVLTESDRTGYVVLVGLSAEDAERVSPTILTALWSAIRHPNTPGHIECFLPDIVEHYLTRADIPEYTCYGGCCDAV